MTYDAAPAVSCTCSEKKGPGVRGGQKMLIIKNCNYEEAMAGGLEWFKTVVYFLSGVKTLHYE